MLLITLQLTSVVHVFLVNTFLIWFSSSLVRLYSLNRNIPIMAHSKMSVEHLPPGKEFPNLNEDESRIIQEQLETTPSTAGYFAIFRYAAPLDVISILVSILACSAGGVGAPLMMVLG
jgi:hypothetical protein